MPDISSHLRKYAAILERHVSGAAALEDDLAFEYAWALELSMLMFNDVPPDFVHHLRCKRDFGTDLVCGDGVVGAQVKHYTVKKIDHADLSKFWMHASVLLKLRKLLLCTTPEARLTAQASDDLDASGIDIRRDSLAALLEKHAPTGPARKKPRAEAAEEPLGFELRRGQSELALRFSQHRSERPFRAQMPCGYGKTVAVGAVLREEMRAGPFRALLLVPWLDLLGQSRRTLERMLPGAKISTVGGGIDECASGFDVLVATHASLPRLVDELDGVDLDLVVVDEAHHLHRGAARSAVLDEGLAARRRLELSATFPSGLDLDFHVTLREAIDEGALADYRLHVVELSAGDRLPALLTLFKERWVEFGATLVVFNKLESAQAFVEGLAGIPRAAVITADTPVEGRRALQAALEAGELAAVACVGCWNEGVDIPGLHTVLFGDLRNSEINKRQVAQRAGRLHPTKPYYRVVFPVQDNLTEAEDIVDCFLREDEKLRRAARETLRTSERGRNRLVVESCGAAEVFAESVWSSIGELLEGIRPSKQAKLAWFKEYCKEKPAKNAVVTVDYEGASYVFKAGKFWDNISSCWFKNRKYLNDVEEADLMATVLWIFGAVEDIMRLRQAKPRGEPPKEKKLAWFKEYCKEKPAWNAVVTVDYKGAPYSFNTGTYWHWISRCWTRKNKYLTDPEKADLNAVHWIPGAIDGLTRAHKAKPRGEPPKEKKLAWFKEYCKEKPAKNAVVTVDYEGAPYSFNTGTYWSTISMCWTGKRKYLTDPEKTVLETTLCWIPSVVAKRRQGDA